MPRKRTPKPRKSLSKSSGSFRAVWLPIEKFFIGLWSIIKTIFRGLLMLLENIFKFVVALVIAVAKVVQAVALVLASVFLALALLALTFFLCSRALDLPNSASFQNFRERTIEIISEAAEPGFATWESNTQAWIDYRADLVELYNSSLTAEEKKQELAELRDALHEQLDFYDPNFLEWKIQKER
ncbi:MAG: hypothetical protein K9L85_03470 [Candidatus Peribacteraceae bacterium]|nr:hypothetical protein [Candidatus Peribacteraceae bacterium]